MYIYQVKVNILEASSFRNLALDTRDLSATKTFFDMFFVADFLVGGCSDLLPGFSFLTEGSSFTTVFFGQPS